MAMAMQPTTTTNNAYRYAGSSRRLAFINLRLLRRSGWA